MSKLKAVVFGIDGAEPTIIKKMMKKGKLPNLEKLAKKGSFELLETTLCSQSPVAWSSFLTGLNPGKHGMFDFISRNPKNLSLELGLNDFRITESNNIEYLNKRKGTPFWKILADKGTKAASLFIPVTFPPEPFDGYLVCGMGVPDLRGTQGLPTIFSTEQTENEDITVIRIENGRCKTQLTGLENSTTEIYFIINENSIEISLNGNKIEDAISKNEWSKWIYVNFDALGKTIEGVCRFKLLEKDNNKLKIYCSPIQISPKKPFLPITHPENLSKELAENVGVYKNISFESDVFGLKQELIDEETWLEDMYWTFDNRVEITKYFLQKEELEFLCVNFFGVDRIQHLFWRFIDSENPRHEQEHKYSNEIEKTYQYSDKKIGELLKFVSEDTVVFIISDHGFSSYNKNVQLNKILYENGLLSYTKLENGFTGIDWENTKAYAVGFSGVFINLKNRENQGIVSRDEYDQVRKRVIELLKNTKDEKNENIFNDVLNIEEAYKGEELDNGPDLLPIYKKGYRASKETAIGTFLPDKNIIEDNLNKWSGDHIGPFFPKDSYGIIICSEKIKEKPKIIDLAPTILNLFQREIPKEMDGRIIL